MPNKVLNTKLIHRIGTTADWSSASSQILANGEIGLERTTNNKIKAKIGDGIHSWSELSYSFNEGGSGGGTTYTAGSGIKIENDTISTIYGDSTKGWEDYNFNNIISTLNINPQSDIGTIFDDIKVYTDYILLVKNIDRSFTVPYLVDKQFKIEYKLSNTDLQTQIFTMATPEQAANGNNNDDSTLIKTMANIPMGSDTTLTLYYTGKTDAFMYYISGGESNATEFNALTNIIDRCVYGTLDIFVDNQYSLSQFIICIPLDVATAVEYFSIYKLNNIYQTIPSNALTAGTNISIGNNATINNTLGQMIEDYENPGWELNNNKIYSHPSAPLFGSVYAYQYTTYVNNNTNYYGLVGWDYGDTLTGCPIYSNFILQDLKGNRVNKLTETITVSDYAILKIGTSLSNLTDIKLSIRYDQMTGWYNKFNSLDKEEGQYFGRICFCGKYNTDENIETILEQESITPNDSSEPALYFLVNTKDYSGTSNSLDFIILTNSSQLNLGSYKILQPSISYNTIPFNSLSTGNAIGYGALAMGKNNEVIGIGSFAAGQNNRVYADNAAAIGEDLYNTIENSLIIGRNNDRNVNALFAISDSSYSTNIFYINSDGQAYCGKNGYYTPYLTPENIYSYLNYNSISNIPTIPVVPAIVDDIGSFSSSTDLTTSPKAVYDYVNGFAQGAMHFRGTTTTQITNDDGSHSAITISGNSYNAQAGDVVLYSGNEFVYDGTYWRKLGDESSWVPQTRTINGHALSSNISLTASDVGAITSSDIADKPSRASYTNGNYAVWDSSGNLTDSGYKIVVSQSAPTSSTANNVITFVY